MANGRPYDPDRFTVSHARLPLGTIVMLTVEETERSTFAVVTDRTPPGSDYLCDVSAAVRRELDLEPGVTSAIALRTMD